MFVKPKPITVEARLLKDNFAIFYKGFHENATTADPFYQKLVSMVMSHKSACGLDVDPLLDNMYKQPFSILGFRFKTDKTKYYNLAGKECLPTECLDLDVNIKLRITPYDFVANSKRLVGLSISALEIKAVKDEN
jgi:hypothetical protein